MPPRIAQFFASMAGRALLVLLLCGAAYWLFSAFTAGQTAKVEAKLNDEQVEATLGTVDAVNETTAALDHKTAQIENLTEELANEILQAPPGYSNDAAIRAVCRMHTYAGRAECAGLREAGAGQPD